ncbi:MAG: ATP synthase F1 subunit delta, partial [Gammaproteobacteria bacterium RIFOXYB2_FULL_38_6]
SDPRFSNEAWLMCLNKIYADMLPNLEKKFSEEINNFLKLLLEYQRLYVLPDILTLYKRLVAMHQGILVVQVSSPFEINETQKKKLTEALEKRYQIKMEMNYHLDKDLLGGVMMRSRGFVIDGSVRGHLRRLKNDLMR